MARIIHMYNQITINLRAPPVLSCKALTSPAMFYAIMIFPIMNTGEPQPQRNIS